MVTVKTLNLDSTMLISIVSLFFIRNNRKSHVTCAFFHYLFYKKLSMLGSDKIIFNNKMHEIDDVGTNGLS